MDYDYEIEFTTKSISDLENIFNYILEISKSIDTAKKISMRIKTSIYHLGIFPKKFSLSNNYKYKNLRKMVIDDWIVFYLIKKQTKKINIIRILSSKTLS